MKFRRPGKVHMSSKDASMNKMNGAEPRVSGDRISGAALDDRLQAHIGGQLKSMYDSYLNAPIPDRLVELLEKLDEVSGKSDLDGTGGSGK